MGASGWSYRAPFTDSVEETVRRLQLSVLAAGDDYIWPWSDVDLAEEPDLADIVRPRPRSLDELAEAKQDEEFEFYSEGTHSILDIDHVAAPGVYEFGAVTPLTDAELTDLFGTATPTAADLDRVGDDPLVELLIEQTGRSWAGVAVVLYDGARPVELYVTGISGD